MPTKLDEITHLHYEFKTTNSSDDSILTEPTSIIMDEEAADTTSGTTTDPEPGFSGNTTVIKQKKKAAPAKKKTDKELAPSKKAKKEIVPAKVTDKAAVPSKKAHKEAVPAKKVDKEAIRAGPQPEKKKTTLDLVCEAIEVLGESRKGLSVPAIKKYIKSKQDYEAPGFNTFVNKALIKGIEKGILERPPASKDATGATGFFRLAKIAPPKRTIKAARKKTDSEHASDSEATVKPVKPRKRNLSDSMIIEMRASTPKPSVKEKTLKNMQQAKKVPKKNPNDKKDTSDSKIVVKKTGRKSVKSYSSDTEVDFKKSKIAKTDKQPAKSGSSPKVSKAKVKKLYNNKEETVTKSGKTRAKRQA